jgi:hypothetical protein
MNDGIQNWQCITRSARQAFSHPRSSAPKMEAVLLQSVGKYPEIHRLLDNRRPISRTLNLKPSIHDMRGHLVCSHTYEGCQDTRLRNQPAKTKRK